MVCVWPVFISVNTTYCFIYLYFFSGSIPHFPFLYNCHRSSHFCCFFHFLCHGNHQWEGYTLVGCMHSSLTGHAHVSELLGSKVILFSVCAHLLTYSAHLLVHRDAPIGLRFNMFPEWGWSPLSSCWAFLFQIGLQWKGRLLIIQYTATEDLYIPCPSVPPYTEIPWDTQSA